MIGVGIDIWTGSQGSGGSRLPEVWHKAVSQVAIGSTTGTYSLGNKITVTKPIRIRALSLFDSGQNGIESSVTVSLGTYDTVFSNLASVSIPTGTDVPLVGGHRFVNLSTPVDLTPGVYYLWVSAATNGFTRAPPAFDTSGAFTFTDSRYYESGFPRTGESQVTYVPCGFEYTLR
jgi:hypothetical protein